MHNNDYSQAGDECPPQPTRMKPCNAAPSGLVSVLTYSLVRTIPSVTGHSGTIILHRVHVCMLFIGKLQYMCLLIQKYHISIHRSVGVISKIQPMKSDDGITNINHNIM